MIARLLLLPGDGIGPEIGAATGRVLAEEFPATTADDERVVDLRGPLGTAAFTDALCARLERQEGEP